jgi:hypothetical protein
MTKKKPADADTSTGLLDPAAYNNGTIQQAMSPNNHAVRLQPHPTRDDMLMLSINGSSFFPVVRAKLRRFSHVRNRALATMVRPTDEAIAIANLQSDGWREAVTAALQDFDNKGGAA